MKTEQINEVLEKHTAFMLNEGGECANLSYANLSGAKIDYSCWPLWCGSFGAKIDARIAAQLVYHAVRACQSVADDDAVKAFCNAPEVIALANRFHRVKECGRINEEGEAAQ